MRTCARVYDKKVARLAKIGYLLFFEAQLPRKEIA
jgi:hypothetical protein